MGNVSELRFGVLGLAPGRYKIGWILAITFCAIDFLKSVPMLAWLTQTCRVRNATG